MLRRKPTKIEIRVEDKEELEEARKRAAAASSSSSSSSAATTSSSSLLHHFDRSSLDPSSKSHRIGLSASLLRNLMEVEVKLRLPNKASYQKLLSLLSPFHVTTHNQHNTFFDGLASELSSRRAILRLRFHEQTHLPKCFVCLKAKAIISNGVSRVEEDEEEVDPAIGRAFFEDPGKLMEVDSSVLRRVKEEFGVSGFVGLGGFWNVRNVYEWNDVKLEVDEAKYEFGDLYEVECESVEPERVKGIIEEFFKENGIEYSDSVMSKFAIFRAGNLPT